MINQFPYQGGELELFAEAKNWKKYFSRFIIPHIKGDVLEVGAGTGNTTLFLNRPAAVTSWTLLEPDPAFCDILQDLINNNQLPENCSLKNETVLSLKKEKSYDTILYIDVLEHIDREEDEIISAAALLRTDGKLIILAPAYQCLYTPFDKAIGHHRRYNKKSLSRVTRIPFLKNIELKYLDSTSCMLSLGNKYLLRQSYPTRKQINLWDSVFIPISVFTDKLVSYTFGKSIFGVWKKS